MLQTIVQNFIGEIVILVLLGIGRFLGIDFYLRILKLWRTLFFSCARLFGYKFILVYTDCDVDGRTTNMLIKKVKKGDSGKNAYVSIKNPAAISTYPLVPMLCSAIVIMITDVTQLSTSEKVRNSIQDQLEAYVVAGGTLVLGHDAIYRRSRNTKLQKLVGCEAIEYNKVTHGEIKYTRADLVQDVDRFRLPDVVSLNDFPTEMILHDNEYIAGRWARDVKYLYCGITDDGKIFPLITLRNVNHGFIFWMNSGDKSEDGEPLSITAIGEDLSTVLRLIVSSSVKGV